MPSDAAKAWERYRGSRSYRHGQTIVGTAPELALEVAFLNGFDAGRATRAEHEETRTDEAVPHIPEGER